MGKNVDFIIAVKSQADLTFAKTTYSNKTKILVHCSDCNIPLLKALKKIDKNDTLDDLRCRRCGIRHAVFQKYGCVNVFQLATVKNKSKETSFQNCGFEYASQSPEFRANVKNTCMRKYGVENITQSEFFKEKARETRLLKNEGQYRNKTEIEKQQETCLSKYGTKACWNLPEVRKTQKATFLARYGKTHFLHTEKYIDVMTEKYGVSNPDYSHEIRTKMRQKYLYKNVGFDSSWELALYIWLEDSSVPFIYQPPGISYMHNNEPHTYYPDFLLADDTYIEIKNPALLLRMQNETSLEHSKYLCMINNNVQIISNCDEYLKYVTHKYGKNYLKSFKKDK